MTGRLFLHTMSLPEIIWLNFFREFFSQQTLVYDKRSSGAPVPNRFFLDRSQDPSNRPFDVTLAYDYEDSRQNALPALVLEDAGAVQMGLTINQMKTWSVSGTTTRERADQVRFTYVFHCLSKDRGESRMLAAMVSRSLTVFRDQLLADGLNKIEPWSIGATQPLRTDSGEDYVDTPVQVTFYTVEFWDTLEIGSGFANNIGISFISETRAKYIMAAMETRDPRLELFILASMFVKNPNASMFIRAGMFVEAPLGLERFFRAALTSEEPVSSERFVRAHMRVS